MFKDLGEESSYKSAYSKRSGKIFDLTNCLINAFLDLGDDSSSLSYRYKSTGKINIKLY